MKWRFLFLFSCSLIYSFCPAQKNQPVYSFASCNNFDFESGYTGWGGQAWNFITSTTFVVTPSLPYHKLTGAGFDNIIAPLSTLAPAGGTQSALIGLPNPGSQEYWIDQTFVVSATDPVYVYQTAVVFKDLDQFSPPHTPAQQNYFEVLFTDQNGDTIPCGYSKVLVSQATAANGFQPYIYNDPNQTPPNNLIPHLWQDWTSTAVDLTPYIGTNVTVRFKAHSCALGDHYTYAYIDGHCEPAVSNGTALTICQGETATLNGPSGFGNYVWLPGGQSTQDIQTGTAGVYTVTATGQLNCIKVQTYTVTVNQPSAIFASPSNVNICVGNSTTLSASAIPATGISFAWSPSAGLSSSTGNSVVASPTSSITYTVVGTDANGCSNAATAQVTVGVIPVAVAPGQTVCSGQAATLTASGGSSYSWNTGETTATIVVVVTSATSYSVAVNNPAGCSDTAVANISISPPFTATVSNATICAGQSGTLTASGANNYSWNTGQSTSSIVVSPSVTSTYTVVVSDALGCTGIATATLSVSPSPTALLSNATICTGQTATITASGGGSYSWSTGQTTASVTANTAGTYSVIVSNANGCTSAATASLTVLQLPIASVSGNTTLCFGQTNTLTASGNGNYFWNAGQTSSSISISPTTSTGYSVTVTNSCGTSTAIANVIVNPLPVANAGSDVTICPGGSTFLSANGTGNYVWSTGTSASSIMVSPSVSTTYTVFSFNSCGSASDPVTVTIGNSLVASVSGTANICVGQGTVLSASGGIVFLWSTGSTSNSISVSPSVTTTYSVVVTSGTCTDTVAYTVNVSPPPVAVSGNATICQGQTAQLSASGGGNYLWNTGATTNTINVSSSGNYSVIVTANGCSDTASATVTVNPNPVASAGSNVNITQGQSATLTAGGGGTYLWNTGSTAQSLVISPGSSSQYCVLVTNTYGCTDTACVTVTLEPTDCSSANAEMIFLPSAFSPNGDGENDQIRILFGFMECIETFRLEIYNRWGERVFETQDPLAVWDGSYGNGPENTAVFAYYLKATLKNGSEIERKGNISLFK